MKKLILTIAAFTTFAASAQVVESPKNGFLPSRLTTAQRDALLDTPGLTGPAKGLVVFNTTTNTLQLNVGTAAAPVWQDQQAAPNNDVIADCNKNVTVVQTITSSTGKVWMDRNMGASRAAQSKTDHYAYGCLYQWGRGNDGHEGVIWSSGTSGTPIINSTTTTLSTVDIPNNNGLFIKQPVSPYDWRATANNNLWNGASRATSPNTPCPTGFRVPTNAELDAEFTAYSIIGVGADNKAFDSPHKYVLAGYRHGDTGVLVNNGVYGNLWSNEANGVYTRSRIIYSGGSYTSTDYRAYGFTVRCIKDINY